MQLDDAICDLKKKLKKSIKNVWLLKICLYLCRVIKTKSYDKFHFKIRKVQRTNVFINP